jgi:hypothetical protein
MLASMFVDDGGAGQGGGGVKHRASSEVSLVPLTGGVRSTEIKDQRRCDRERCEGRSQYQGTIMLHLKSQNPHPFQQRQSQTEILLLGAFS